MIGALVALWFKISLRAIGLIMGFGAGVLISAVAFDLSTFTTVNPPYSKT